MTDIAVDTPTPTALDNSRVWLLAGAPLLLLAIDAAFLYSGYSEGTAVSWIVAVAVNVGICAWDSRYLKSRGHDLSAGLAVVLVPLYLWARSRKLDLSQAPLAAWLAAFVVSITGTLALGAHFVTLNMPMVRSGIEQWAQRQGAPGDVSCPSRTVYAVHDSFTCSVGSMQLLVTVENSNGYITWEPVSG